MNSRPSAIGVVFSLCAALCLACDDAGSLSAPSVARQSPADAGRADVGAVAPRDARIEPAPGDGMPVFDAGEPVDGATHDATLSVVDASEARVDAGWAMDAAAPDAGAPDAAGDLDGATSDPDAAPPPADAGELPADGAAPPDDAAPEPIDSEGVVPDAGPSPSADAEVVEPDVQPRPVDAAVGERDAMSTPAVDAAPAPVDAEVHNPDAERPPLDAGGAQPDAAALPADAAVVEPDIAPPPVDSAVVEPDMAPPPVDAEVVEPDMAPPPVDAEVLEPDMAPPPIDAAAVEPDMAPPPVDAEAPEPDAAIGPLEPRTTLAGPFPLDGAAVGRLDIVWDALAVSPDGALAAAAYKVTGAPAQSRLGLWTADGAARLWLSDDPVWSEGCDFHPDGARIYCAHQPRPQWGVTDLLVVDAADGSTLARVPVPTVDPDPQPEPYWGDAVRVSPDGRWVAMAQQSARLGRGQVVVFEIPAAHAAIPVRVASFAAENPDEVAFGLDSDSLYASAFIGPHILRAVLEPGGWILDGLRMVDTSVAGLDVDGLDRPVVTGWDSARVLIVDPHAGRAWRNAPIVRARVAGTSYELCADGRPGAPWAWSIAHGDGAVPVHAIDTDTGDILAADTVSPAQTDGIAMSCARETGQPFIVTRGRLWTWEVAE